jgi:hypothetical protein
VVRDGELFVERRCYAGNGNVKSACAFVGGRLGDPDLFALGSERCGGEGESEAPYSVRCGVSKASLRS